ncbi:MAG: multicopper oxidase domain-containing protein [Nitrosomonas sp.]|nr:multicopper oxidase domain-containing protein [Nitrosomonas sp.]
MERRAFLKASALGLGSFTLSGLTFGYRQAHAANHIFSITAEPQSLVVNATTSLNVWRYRDLVATSGPGGLQAGIVVQQGDSIEINLSNNLDRNINLVIPGLVNTSPQVAPGSSFTYLFTLNQPGSFFLTDNISGFIAKAMGLAMPLVVLPNTIPASLNDGLTPYDRQYTLVFQDYDDRLNAAISGGGAYTLDQYEPNFFTVNGLQYPSLATDPDSRIEMTVGEQVAIRFINAGSIYYPMHFHGYHVSVANRNRVVESNVIEKDTVLVRTAECVDVQLAAIQAGTYPLHTHFVPGVTSNGVYAGGGLLVMNASAAGPVPVV